MSSEQRGSSSFSMPAEAKSIDLGIAGHELSRARRVVSSCLGKIGVSSPEAEARWILSEAMGIEGSQLLMYELRGAKISLEVAERIGAILERRSQRVPLQYILGQAPFRGLILQVGPGVLIPRPETEMLVDLVLAHVDALGQDSQPRVLDAGTGSGAIAAAIASERPRCRVQALDLSPEALSWATKNTMGLGIELIVGDFSQPIEAFESSLDVLVSNPPYVPRSVLAEEEEAHDVLQPEARFDPPMALYGGGVDGLELPLALTRRAGQWLRPGGFFAMEHEENQGESLRQALKDVGFDDVKSVKDLTGRERFTTGVLSGGSCSAQEREHGRMGT